MKRFMTLTAVVVLMAQVSGCPARKAAETSPAAVKSAPALSGPKKRVGVFEFENKSRYGQNKLSDAAVDVLYTELSKAGVFVLYERSAVTQLNREFKLIDSGQVNLETAAEVGKLVGVQAVVVGTITSFGLREEAKDYGVYKKKTVIAEATVDVRVVDVTSGRIIYAGTGTGKTEQARETVLGFGEKGSFDETMADKALRAAMIQFTADLIKQVMQRPWEGSVMDVEQKGGSEVLYINAGRLSGMPAGQKLLVSRVTGKLTDPQTGEFKGSKTEPLGEAAVYDFSGEDVSMARMTKGSGAKRGDLVTEAK